MKWISLLFAAGCLAPPIESPPTTTVAEARIDISTIIHHKVDLLFMIDNSNSMRPKQDLLKDRFPSFITRLRQFASQGLPASYHIGVVTSDLGAGITTCGKNDGGRLNTVDRSDRLNAVSCNLGGGLSFLDYNQLDGTANVVGSVEDAFQCIASVGTEGCGFEHQLESVYRALTTDVPENRGFLRDDAVLAVVFLTDEDDCSAPPDSDLFVRTLNGIDYSQPGNYGPFNSFRCTQFGILNFGEPLPWPPTGDYLDPEPAPPSESPGPGKLFGVDRYVHLFTEDRATGGVKDRPEKSLMLISIAAPPMPFGTFLSDPSRDPPRPPCSTYNGTDCTVTLKPSCTAAGHPEFTGDPAVRLHAVVSQAANHDETTSICDDSYDQALGRLGDFIRNHIGQPCLGVALDHPDMPDCVVIETLDGKSTFLPWCAAPGAGKPCWQLVDLPTCDPVTNPKDGTQQQLGLEIVRDQEPEGDLHDDARCAVITSSMK
jgi:hypothetical protein